MYRQQSFYEKTLVLVKPDGVQRGLIGELTQRIERKGLKIVGMKMVWPSPELASEHYYWPEEDRLEVGNRTLRASKERGVEDNRDPLEIAEWVHGMLIDALSAGPVVAMVIEGAHAVRHIRTLRGKTNPADADIGSVAGDYTIDSFELADWAQRSIRNIMHASGSVDEARREIALWFKPEEILDYDLAIEKILYTKEWEKLNQDKNPHKKD